MSAGPSAPAARRLPDAAFATAPATLPPADLPGLDPAWSRLVAAPDAHGVTRTWHVLDNAPLLAARAGHPDGAAGARRGTILAVHGNPTWSYLWRRLLEPAAAAGWRVLAVDQLDMGFSERTGTARTLADRVADLGALTGTLAAAGDLDGPVVTLGHDWGGVVSLGWAVDHPDLLAGVLLLNTAVHQGDDAPVPAPLRLALAAGVLGHATVTTPAFLETTLALGHPPLPAAVKDAYRAPYRGADRRGGIGAFVADIPVAAGHASSAELTRVAEGVRGLTVPAFVQWGPRDPVFRDRYLDDLVTRLPHAQVHRHEGAGHLLAEDVDYVTPVLTWLDAFGVGAGGVGAGGVGAGGAGAGGAGAGGAGAGGAGAGGAGAGGAGAGGIGAGGAGAGGAGAGGVGAGGVGAGGVGAGGVGAGGASAARSARAARAARAASSAPEPARPYVPLWHHLDERADDASPALVEMAPRGADGPRTVSWRLLSRRVREIAAGLVAFGVRPGDRVSLLVPPGADLTAVLYACVRVGAVVVVADAGLGVRGLTRAVRGAQPRFVVGELPGLTAARALGWPGRRISTRPLPRATARALGVEASLSDLVEVGAAIDLTEALADTLPGAGVGPAPAPDAVAAILFTSGSTGPAKGVVYTHEALASVRDVLAAQYDVGPRTGLVAGFAPFALLGPALGARSVTPDMDVTAPRTLTARAVAAAAAEVDATVVFLSPAALTNVVATSDALDDDGRAALGRVRTFLSAGAPISPELLAAAQRLMPHASAHTPYGMTEGLLMTDADLAEIQAAIRSADGPAADGSADRTPDAHPGASPHTGPGGVLVGAPAAGVELRVAALDTLGAATGLPSDARGVTGEVVVSAPHLKARYDRLWLTDRAAVRATPSDGPTATATDPATGTRWHRTGDVGRLDADGRLWIEGRLGHVVSTPDGPLTPVGPEQRAESLAGVARAAAVGVGPRGTQQLVLVVETVARSRRVRLADAELAADVRRVVGRPVAAVLVVPRLPTDVRHNSKVDRSALSAWAERVLSGGRLVRP